MVIGLDAVRLTERPLVVCDVDDVVLEFVTPFRAFLESRGHRLLPRSFRLHGNIVCAKDETALEDAAVSELIEAFFAAQEAWQTPFIGVADTLARLAARADLVFVTAMPARHAPARRRLLDFFALAYPLIAADEAKGPVVQRLHAGRPLPLAFVDDMVHNLHSVGEHVPDCLLVHLPPPVDIHSHAPPAGAGVRRALDWRQAEQFICAHLAA